MKAPTGKLAFAYRTISELEAERDQLSAEAERLRMQLAACGVVALANTPESAAKARDMHPDYMSASCQDVMSVVDREMALRAVSAEKMRADFEAWLAGSGLSYAEGIGAWYGWQASRAALEVQP